MLIPLRHSLTIPCDFANSPLESKIYLSKVRRRLDLPDWLHESVSDDDLDVRSGVAFGSAAEFAEVDVADGRGGVTQVKFEHAGSVRKCRCESLFLIFVL